MKNKLFLLLAGMFAFSACHSELKKFIIEDSDVVEISKSVVERLNDYELWIARNEIYARKGRQFSNHFLESYFYNCEWYIPKIEPADFDENLLSDVEKRNVQLLYSEQTKRKKQKKFPIKCEFDKVYLVDLDGDNMAEKLRITYKEGTYELESLDIYVNNKKFNVASNILELNEREFYITDIARQKPGLEIALMDYGPSSDLETHFYVYSEGNVQHIGSVGDFPFENYKNIDGFGQEGIVMATLRTDVIETTFSYACWIYDYDNKTLSLREDSMYNVAPIRKKTLKKPIYIYTKKNTDSPKKYMQPQPFYFLASDGKEWMRVRCEDNTIGYMHDEYEWEEKYNLIDHLLLYD